MGIHSNDRDIIALNSEIVYSVLIVNRNTEIKVNIYQISCTFSLPFYFSIMKFSNNFSRSLFHVPAISKDM